MKKLLIIITLFVSSFFFISLKETKAATTTQDISDYSLVLSKDFINVQNLSSELFSTLDYQNYVILYNDSIDSYVVWFFNNDYITFKGVYDLGYYYCISFTHIENVRYNYDSLTNELIFDSEFSYSPDYYTLRSVYFLYSTVDIRFKYYSQPGKFIYNIPDFSKSYTSESDNDSLVPTLYDICVDSGNCIISNNNPHQEELEKVESFYNVIIEKLSYLGEVLVSNYIYLSIIGIFIVTFVFLLIFRRFL